ncbi:acyl carrier protein [Stackebrandtia nassauensis]|uniref:Phosphopantetheine-binding protein n=1 Tax=Stackebrandtia nassauensis (strain DSM 44728 / CIP 108903 / NRRL B-16338 / NBRC 102104 / LLR-40K-21) TaxID=446470 RepID=D3PVQ4_STANL|nr:acyl carrier protein [Stackebrandtia nassauensis]ADD43168.1 phosphopantetheine-binding protein [Stackebrandtia nassauensis DSM 44728]
MKARTHIEKVIADEAATVLQLDHLDTDANLFDHGCDSMRAIDIAMRLEAAFDVDMTVTDVFDYPTVRLLAEQVRRRSDSS